mmetsp:Transcript_11339/g.20503  ORF Transcript_11339/g.20503 Transcript_11339/m.20503 type:complete len:152 (-) Transcript_11339:1412-1867(-)
MVYAQKLVAENLQSVVAMLVFTFGAVNLSSSREFPVGMRDVWKIVGDKLAALVLPKYSRIGICIFLLCCSVALYTSEQLLSLALLWIVHLALAIVAQKASNRSAECLLLLWTLWILISIQIYCVLYVAVRRKAKQLRREREQASQTPAQTQ